LLDATALAIAAEAVSVAARCALAALMIAAELVVVALSVRKLAPPPAPSEMYRRVRREAKSCHGFLANDANSWASKILFQTAA
jgi:hypothetical protein